MLRVRDAMTTAVVRASPTDTLQQAHDLFEEGKIRHLPIVEGGKLIGVVPNRPGMLASVTGVIKDLNVNIAAVFLSPDKGVSYRLIVLRLDTTDPSGVAASLEEAGYEVYSVESTAPVETTLEEA